MRYSVSDYWVYDFAKVGRLVLGGLLTGWRTWLAQHRLFSAVRGCPADLAVLPGPPPQPPHAASMLSSAGTCPHFCCRSGSAPRTTPTTWCMSSSTRTTLRPASRPSQVGCCPVAARGASPLPLHAPVVSPPGQHCPAAPHTRLRLYSLTLWPSEQLPNLHIAIAPPNAL